MSPADYLKSVRPLKLTELTKENISDIQKHIEEGGFLDPLVIYANGKEDGRHRAHATKLLGMKEVPVLLFGNACAAFEKSSSRRNPRNVSLQEHMKRAFPNVVASVSSTGHLSKIIVPERGLGEGTSFMKELVKEADLRGLFLTLTPSKDFGASSIARLVRFYKRFGFVENKGRNKIYEISETMYRDPS